MDFSVDVPSLRSDGRRIEGIPVAAEGDLGRLHGETVAAGPAAWGTAVPVAAAYDELTAVTGEVLGLVGTVLAAGGTGVTQMADAYEHADSSARDRFHGIDGRGAGSPP